MTTIAALGPAERGWWQRGGERHAPAGGGGGKGRTSERASEHESEVKSGKRREKGKGEGRRSGRYAVLFRAMTLLDGEWHRRFAATGGDGMGRKDWSDSNRHRQAGRTCMQASQKGRLDGRRTHTRTHTHCTVLRGCLGPRRAVGCHTPSAAPLSVRSALLPPRCASQNGTHPKKVSLRREVSPVRAKSLAGPTQRSWLASPITFSGCVVAESRCEHVQKESERVRVDPRDMWRRGGGGFFTSRLEVMRNRALEPGKFPTIHPIELVVSPRKGRPPSRLFQPPVKLQRERERERERERASRRR